MADGTGTLRSKTRGRALTTLNATINTSLRRMGATAKVVTPDKRTAANRAEAQKGATEAYKQASAESSLLG